MEFRYYIEQGIAKCGTAVALGKALEQGDTVIRNAKAHRRGLPVYACIKLAELIDADPMEVIAASELVTEKKEERRAIFLPFVQAIRRLHPMIAAIATGAILTIDTINQLASLTSGTSNWSRIRTA